MPFTISFGVEHNPRNFVHSGEFLLAPFFYPDYEYEPAQATVSSKEPLASTTSLREEPEPISPLLIERQGNRFLRITASEYNSLNARPFPTTKGEYQRNVWREKIHAQAPKLRPTMLVLRDGRQEQTSNYIIVGGTVFEYPDYWIGGSSTKKISLAELDIEATLKANQERGVKFVLPKAPNEVITRP